MRSNIIFSILIFLLGIINIYAQTENYALFYNKGEEMSKLDFDIFDIISYIINVINMKYFDKNYIKYIHKI